jgi:hypothetical protein
MSDMRRRELITLLGGAAATWPVAARGQQGERVRRIGVLVNGASDDWEGQARLAAFEQGLQQLGWTAGHRDHGDQPSPPPGRAQTLRVAQRRCNTWN